MKKRILSLIIVALMLFQIQPIFAVDREVEVDFSHYVKCEDLLKALSIVEGGKNFEETVTRGQAAYNIASLLNETSNFQPYRGIFSDVKIENEYALAIEKLADLGVVRGDGNYCFNPDQHITYNEATIMLMNALGYSLINEQNNYNEAAKIGLWDNVQREYDVVNFGDLYTMMYNTLFASPIVQTSYGSDVEYQKSEQTMLYKLFDVVYTDGVVIKNDFTYLWSDKGITEDSIVVRTTKSGDIEIFPEDISTIRNDLGKNIRVYFIQDRESGKNKYVYHVVRDINNIIELTFEDLEPSKTNFSQRKLAYYKDGDSKPTTIALANNYNIIYNNVVYNGDKFDFSKISDKSGNVAIVDANGDKSYETIVIKAFENYIVENISLTYGYLSDKYDKSKKLNIDEDEYEKILVYNEQGERISLSNINVGSVVSVALCESNSGSNMLEIHVSENIKNGKITQFKKDGTRKYIVLDGSEKLYLFDRADDKDYVTNSNVLVYFDAFGNIIYIADDKARDMQYGLLVGVDSSGGSFDTEIKVRIITASAELIETKLDKKVVIDGEKLEGKAQAEYLSGVTVDTASLSLTVTFSKELVPIRYKLDENGIVKIIDTPNGKNEKTTDALTCIGGGNYNVSSGNVIGHKIPYSSDATVFFINAYDYNDIETYIENGALKSTNAASILRPDNPRNMITYSADVNSQYADFIVIFNSDADYINIESELFVIDEVTQGYNEEKGEVMTLLTGYHCGVYKELWVLDTEKTNISMCNKGDILRLGFDLRNYVISARQFLIRNSDGSIKSSNLTGTSGATREKHLSVAILTGFVKNIQGSLLQTNQDVSGTKYGGRKLEDINWNAEEKYVTNIAGIPIVVVDDSEGEVRTGSIEDIRDFDNFDSDCSFVLIRWRSGNLKEVIVYNK